MAALPLGVAKAAASPLNPEQTIIKPPDALPWKSQPNFPPSSVDNCALTGDPTAPGLYYTLVRWHPGYMSAPHFYSTDRYCMVLSEPGGATAAPTSTPPRACRFRPAATSIASP
jgi:hypothetical protein